MLLLNLGDLSHSRKPGFAFGVFLKGRYLLIGEANLLIFLAKQDDSVYMHPRYAIISQ